MTTARERTESGADEFYAWPGGCTFRRHPYWVARTGRTVTFEAHDAPAEARTHHSIEEARAAFAEATCEPDGPAAPRPGDLIRIVWGDAQDEKLTIESVVTQTVDEHHRFGVTGARSGRPLVLIYGQYEILARPIGDPHVATAEEVADLASREPARDVFVRLRNPNGRTVPVRRDSVQARLARGYERVEEQ
jgi:hypothetical protein